MDFLLELLFGLFFELPMEAAMESRRVKTWVKTAIIAVLCALLLAMIAGAAWLTWCEEGWSLGTIFLCVFALVGLGFTVWFTADGHKRGWKKDPPF